MVLSIRQQVIVVRLEGGSMLQAMAALNQHLDTIPPARIVELVMNPSPLKLPLAPTIELAAVVEFEVPIDPNARFDPLMIVSRI